MEWAIVKSNEMTTEEKHKAKTTIKYPKINHTLIAEREYHKYYVEHGIQDVFFNVVLTMELKRDGSNLRLIYFGDDKFGLLSRNQYASDDFIKKVEQVIKQNPRKYEPLLCFAQALPCIVFMELFGKGNSPAGFDNNEPLSLEAFDVYVPCLQKWLNRKTYADYLPTVPLIAIGKATTRIEYVAWITKCHEWCDDKGKEGVVIKADHPIVGRIFTKEKVAKALEKPKKQPKPNKSILPALEISEIMGAINKVHVDIGEDIWKKPIAMPKIAIAINEECKKHERSSPHNFYHFYLKYLEGIKHG